MSLAMGDWVVINDPGNIFYHSYYNGNNPLPQGTGQVSNILQVGHVEYVMVWWSQTNGGVARQVLAQLVRKATLGEILRDTP